jgi:drug/metabolite transporter (DMT)-like permease
MLAAFLTTILFSLSAVCGHRTARLLGGTEANFWRLVFATTLLSLYAHGAGAGVTGAAFPLFFLSGCIGFGLGDAALFQALPRLGSRLSVLMVTCLSSPLAALAEWLWLGTGLTLPQIVCALGILAGVVIALAPSEHLHATRRQLIAGAAFGFSAAVCQAAGAVLSRKAFAFARDAAENVDGITAAYQRILGGVAVTAVLLLVVKRRAIAVSLAGGNGRLAGTTPDRRSNWRRAWPWVLLNGLAGPALGVSCYQWALKTTPTGVVLPIVAITPLVIVPFARYFEGERPTARSLGGGLLAVAGAVALAWVSGGAK